MTKATTATKLTLIAAMLERSMTAKPDSSEGPYDKFTVQHLAGGTGLRQGHDRHPARNMAPAGALGAEMEAARSEGLEAGRKDLSAKRMAKAKSRAQRKAEFEKIVNDPTPPDPVRLEQAWLVVVPLMLIVTRIAKSKQRWANRLLGSATDDIPQVAIEAMARALAKQTRFDLDVLRTAAEQLGAKAGVPGDQKVKEGASAEQKEVKRCRKWLMGLCNNRVMGALTDAYGSHEHADSVLTTISGVDDDAFHSSFKAARAPAMLSTRFQRTDSFDPELLAVAVNAAIREFGLDDLTDFLLDEEHLRTDGAVKWSKYAKEVFLLSPGDGQWMWDQVKAATAGHKNPRAARGRAAMTHTRNLFEFLPSLVVSVVDAFDPRTVGWSTKGSLLGINTDGDLVKLRPTTKANGIHAVLASHFDLFYRQDPTARMPLAPALKYATAEEAAQALVHHFHAITREEIA